MISRQNSLVDTILAWVYVAIIAAAIFLIGLSVHRALAYSFDPFVRRIEFLMHVMPGGYIPVNPEAPDIRLQYLGARKVAPDTYDVRVHRIR